MNRKKTKKKVFWDLNLQFPVKDYFVQTEINMEEV